MKLHECPMIHLRWLAWSFAVAAATSPGLWVIAVCVLTLGVMFAASM